MPCRSTTPTFNPKDLQFEGAVRHDLSGRSRSYHTQTLKYHSQDLFLTSDWFNCLGVKENFDKKLEMLVPISSENSNILKGIEDLAIAEGLKFPIELQTNITNEQFFKRLPCTPNLYIKLDHDVVCFDKDCNVINLDALSRGDFRVIIHVKGLYLGQHSNGKLASLQLRIVQIQNIPRTPQCMFVGIPIPNVNQQTAVNFVVPETPPPTSNQTNLLAPVKKGRKPKLQRQNTISDARIQQQEHNKMEALPSDFFNDLDLSALRNNH